MLAVRKRNLLHLRAERLVDFDCRPNRLFHLRVESCGKMLFGEADLQPGERLVHRRRVFRHRLVKRRRIARVVAGDRFEQKRGVFHRVGHWTDLVETAGERDQTIAAHPAIGRFHADDAAEPGRLTDRAAGVGADRQRHHPRRHTRRRPAARTAGRALEVPRIVRHLKGGVLGRAAHRELVHIRATEQHRSLGLELGDDGRIVGRTKIGQHPRSASCQLAAFAEQVLHRDRQPAQATDRLLSWPAANRWPPLARVPASRRRAKTHQRDRPWRRSARCRRWSIRPTRFRRLRGCGEVRWRCAGEST